MKENEYFIVEGDCEVAVTGCVNSPYYPAPHANEESCTITVKETGAYTLSDEFDIETCCDHLVVNDTVTLLTCERVLFLT